jgi:hypothetical protein
MKVGRKIYYELQTGDVVLVVPEKFSGIQTTKEQDFAMYETLSIRNPETVGVIQLEYGQYSSDFQTCSAVRVDVATGNLLFNYPVFEQPLSVTVNRKYGAQGAEPNPESTGGRLRNGYSCLDGRCCVMPAWKKNIFVRVVSRRMAEESRTAENILSEYPALTADEKAEIMNALAQ